MTTTLEHKGWSYSFKVRSRYLVMKRECPDAGLSFVEQFDFDCWPAQVRISHMDDLLRRLSVPAKARKLAISIIPV